MTSIQNDTVPPGDMKERTCQLVKPDGTDYNDTDGAGVHHLYCVSGSQAGNWYSASGDTWAATELSNTMTFVSRGQWFVDFPIASPFVAGDVLIEYWRSGVDGEAVTLSRRIVVEDSVVAVADGMHTVPTVGGSTVHQKLDKIDGQTSGTGGKTLVAAAQQINGGTVNGDFNDTHLIDGVEVEVTAAGKDYELHFQFQPGDSPAQVTVNARVTHRNRPGTMQVWNAQTVDWELDTLISDSVPADYTINGLTSDHIDGTNLVRVRFFDAGAMNTGDSIWIDYTGVSTVPSSVPTADEIANEVWRREYPDNAIHVNIDNGFAGQQYRVHGTLERPSNNLTDAKALANLLGVKRLIFHSDVTLDQAVDDFWIGGINLYIELNGNGRSAVNATFDNLTVKGVFVGDCDFMNCIVDGATVSGGLFSCWLTSAADALILGSGAELYLTRCQGVSVDAPPEVDLANVANAKVRVIGFEGQIIVNGISSTANVIIDGVTGNVQVQGASGGVVTVTGVATLDDQSAGALTIVQPARLDLASIDGELSTNHGSNGWETADGFTTPADLAPLALEASVQTVITTGGTGPWTGDAGLTQQQVRDAMKLAPTGGAPAAESIDDYHATTHSGLTTVIGTGGSGPWTTADTAPLATTAELDAQTTDIKAHGDAGWATATGFSVPGDQMGLTAAGVDAIWDEEQSGHVTAGTFGLYLDAKVSEAGGGGGNVTVESFTQAALEQFGQDAIAAEVAGSIVRRSQGAADPSAIWAYDVRTLTSTTGVTVIVSPVTEDATLEIVQGDDYDGSFGDPIQISSDAWPDLTGATIRFQARRDDVTLPATPLVGSVINAGQATQTVVIPMTSTESAGFEVGKWTYEIEAQDEAGKVRTLARGHMEVTEQIVLA